MCVNPSKAVNIDMKKGMIKEGFLADFVVWNPFESFNFDFESLIQQSNLREPEYLGQEHIFNKKNFYGSVIMTIMRGKRCYERKDVIDEDNKLKHLYVFHRING